MAQIKTRKQIQAEAELELRRRFGSDFRTFIENSDKNYQFYKQCNVLINVLDRVANGELKRVMIFMPPRHGKLCADSTPILTDNGWTIHGELKIDDFVFHPNGKRIKVVGIGKKDYANLEVEFSNGEKIKCHKEHEWTVYDRGLARWKTIETQDIQKTKYYSGGRSRFQLSNINAVEFLNNEELPLEPYFFGAWLGDGTSTAPNITSELKDIDIINNITYNANKVFVHKDTGVPTYSFSHQGIIQKIRNLGCYNNKHIPDIYKFSSIENRLKLLAGIIDTDGSKDKHSRYRIVTVSKHLADDIAEVITGLGMRPYIMIQQPHLSTSGIQGKQVTYSIGFQPTMEIPVALERKRVSRIVKQNMVGIVSIKECEPEQGNCIQVDSEDGLYLVGKTLLPTHNSETASRKFPAHYLFKNPSHHVGLTSYSAELAYTLSRDARNNYEHTGRTLSDDASAVKEWHTDQGGRFWSAGVGGSITGKGFHCFIGSTKILTVTGQKEIKDVKEGDVVLSYNHINNKFEYSRVLATNSKISNKIIYVNLYENGGFLCTEDHLIYDATKDEYILASQLTNSSKLLSSTNKTFNVCGVFRCNFVDTVFDIQVEDNHNFFANNYLVHNCGIIDDPIKNQEEAYSDKVRESVWDWYRTTFYTRQEPNAAIIIVQTRWHADDLSGRLLQQEKEIPENWHIVNFQAIKDIESSIKIPETCTVEPDWREDGQALCPERYDEKKLFMMRKSAGEEIWGALYQQNPIIASGMIWKREWFDKIVYDEEPENLQNVGYDWDTAETENEKNAAYAFVKAGVNPVDGLIYVSEIDFKWLDFADYINWMMDMGGVHFIEGKSSGKSAVSMMNKVGMYAYEVPVKGGDKVARARIASPMVERGKVKIKRNILRRLLYDDRQGLIKFPLGSHKDLNDAFVQMLNRLSPYTIREVVPEREKEWWELAYPEYAQSRVNPLRPTGFR